MGTFFETQCICKNVVAIEIDFYRVSICEGGLGSRNSICPSVGLSYTWIVTKLNDALQTF